MSSPATLGRRREGSCTIGRMTVPGRAEAASLLLRLDPPAWFVRHSAGVAEVAAFLAARASDRDVRVDRRLIEAAALLHDVDKLLPAADPARRLGHGRGSADWLGRQGCPELARAVSSHPVTRLVDRDDDPGTWTLETAVVAYADKRVRQRLVPMRERFARWRRRHPDLWGSDAAGQAEERAAELERRVCVAAGVAPGEVRRLRWVGAALAAARTRTRVAARTA